MKFKLFVTGLRDKDLVDHVIALYIYMKQQHDNLLLNFFSCNSKRRESFSIKRNHEARREKKQFMLTKWQLYRSCAFSLHQWRIELRLIIPFLSRKEKISIEKMQLHLDIKGRSSTFPNKQVVFDWLENRKFL